MLMSIVFCFILDCEILLKVYVLIFDYYFVVLWRDGRIFRRLEWKMLGYLSYIFEGVINNLFDFVYFGYIDVSSFFYYRYVIIMCFVIGLKLKVRRL